MKEEPIHDYDRYQPLAEEQSAPVGDYERYERAAERRKIIWGIAAWFLLLFLGLILSRVVRRWLEF